MSVPYHAVGDAAEKRICSARLTVTAHDNKIGEPLFSAIQDQSLWRSVVHDEFEFFLSPPRDFGDARSCCFGILLHLWWKFQCGNAADIWKQQVAAKFIGNNVANSQLRSGGQGTIVGLSKRFVRIRTEINGD